MTILLLDDEPVILHGIERILRRKYDAHHIVCYNNPLEALEYISHDLPDLVISDVYMPEMNGLEFLAQAQAAGCRRYALLTGYDEFDLAQQAIRLHTIDYLLKPVNKAELFALVDSVESELNQARDDARLRQRDVLRLITLYDVFPNEFTADLLTAEMLHAKHLMLMMAPSFDGMPDVPQGASLIHLGANGTGQEVALLFGDLGQDFQDRLFAWLNQAEGRASEAVSPWSIDMLGRLYADLIAHREDHVMQKLLRAYQPPLTAGCTFEVRLMRHLEAQDHALSERVQFLLELADALGFQATRWGILELLGLYGTQDPVARMTYLHAWLSALEPKFSIRSSEILMAVDYINTHYAENITLASLAEIFYWQPTYISAMFHQETGVTFNRYLTRVRMDNACRLMMADPNSSLEEISEKTGITNHPYFFKLFKDQTGITPREFCNRYQEIKQHISQGHAST